MTEKQIESLIERTVSSAPDVLWKNVKYQIAKRIADDLLAELDKQKEPKKQESLDRVNAMILAIIPKFVAKERH